ncbi:glutamate-rich 6-like [Brachionus plicatilis]|uniref:Glutamate-rich 6-like n=1 Tax=Brachionus plicatilis TaxID=10195 RepID=A0A3M7TAU2_BRAPC|nr:glutamate-rich 6-like [Brachionus plicatilis]
MSDYYYSSDTYTILNEIKNSRKTRPWILSNFPKESTSTNGSVKSEPGNQNSVETQKDRSWIQNMKLMKRIRSEGAEIFEEIVNELGQLSNSEQEDEPVATYTPRPTAMNVESIGPPKILQFNPEAKQSEIPPREPSQIQLRTFGGEYCEFCGEVTKAWPSIHQQERLNPELLHCCNDYREFVEALIQYQIEKDRVDKLYLMDYESQKKLVKNAKAREIAEERAELKFLNLKI